MRKGQGVIRQLMMLLIIGLGFFTAQSDNVDIGDGVIIDLPCGTYDSNSDRYGIVEMQVVVEEYYQYVEEKPPPKPEQKNLYQP